MYNNFVVDSKEWHIPLIIYSSKIVYFHPHFLWKKNLVSNVWFPTLLCLPLLQRHPSLYPSLPYENILFNLSVYSPADPLLSSRCRSRRRVLEFGCGPVPVYAASAAYFTESITLGEITPANRWDDPRYQPWRMKGSLLSLSGGLVCFPWCWR